MHRHRQRGRPAVAGELAHHQRHLADRRSSAAELLGDGEGEHARVAQAGVRLAHPRAVSVVTSGMLGEHRPERGSPGDEFLFPVRGDRLLQCDCHAVDYPNRRESVASATSGPHRSTSWTSTERSASTAHPASRGRCPASSATAPSPQPSEPSSASNTASAQRPHASPPDHRRPVASGENSLVPDSGVRRCGANPRRRRLPPQP